MKLYCCECKTDVEARLTNGKEVYPHRPDLFNLPFWKCDTCGNFVGCQHKTKDRTKPLGCIANQEIKNARMKIHAIIDPLWKSRLVSRNYIYSKLSEAIGKEYHTAEIRSMKEVDKILEIAQYLSKSILHKTK